MSPHKLPPRQKMINMMYLVLTALLALNVTAEVLNAFKTVDDGINRSNASLETKNAALFASFEKQMQLDAKKTAPYQQKALRAKEISQSLYVLLDKYKQQIINEAGGIDSKTGQLKKNDNIDIATRTFVEDESTGKALKEKIIETRKELVNLVEEKERSKIRLKELPKPIKKGKKTASKKEESADIPKEIEIKYEEIKKSLLQELEDSWMAKTKENVIFISATQNRNTAELRQLIFEKVKQLYEVRYPYKAGYWQDYTQLQNQEPAKKPSKKR
jgi:hypothetical protein